ncbi:MAG: aldehyde ferredoxin oxidoreductase C-terminal domain-containing protein [Thermodesulfobacteriota bacterium]|nr:aldehyde ferredoxin oxidoreductase C-terminal domain-containing protein [Thermodesulfobacteriota bacterium]
MVRKFDTLLDEYYKARGWSHDGIPTPDKLKELGLESVVGDIERFSQ